MTRLTRRSALKLVHWTMVPLFAWFTLVQPRDVARWGHWWVELHSVFGLVFVSLALLWTADYLRRGLAGRPGPKLPDWGKRLHRRLHLTLVWGMFAVAVTGFLLGLTASRQLFAGDVVPIAVPLDKPLANDWIGIVHSIEFYALAAVAIAHASFHIWRHIKLRDNALRIMMPKMLHRYL
ncbi:cytochrome b/b6 domain-containing protein [Ahrensia sp. R2A130]|uniref:cytochrome b/b6 domain-containing protein n=1 Tax=Ahrensia sp. R2A130 TaxID=744979 RepID=UPI00058C4194|nr:cytochrome b/b6 domain-containing protein [Ahrensia sp. R2A130]